MKKNIALLAVLAIGAINTTASLSAEEATAPSLALNSSMGYESKYLFHSVQYAEAIITPSINAFYGPYYLGTWFAVPVKNDALYSDEMDLYAGYNYALSDLVSIDFGVIHFSYNNCVVGFLDEGNSTQFNLGFNFNTILKPNIYFSRDIDCYTNTVEGKISYSVPLVKSLLSLDLAANLGYTCGENDYVDYTFWGAKADLTYAVKEGASLSVGLRYNASTEEYYFNSADDIDYSKSAIWYAINFVGNF
jgi:hypothetical protein